MKNYFKTILIVSLVVFLLAACSSPVTEPIFATVGKDTISLKAYEETVRQHRFSLINQYRQVLQELTAVVDQPALQEPLSVQLAEISAALDPTIVGQNVLNSMVNNMLIRQEAQRRGISVSKTELDAYIRRQFGFYTGNGQPLPTQSPVSTLDPTQVALGLQAVQATLAPAPTPTSIAETDFVLLYADYIQQIKQEANVSETAVLYFFESSLYREKVEAAIIADAAIEREREQVWARHIQVENEEAAQSVLDSLKKGDSFAAVARSMSIDPTTANLGGDMGWFIGGETLPEFEEAAFSLKIGEISTVVKTANGYHIIQVLGHETKPIDQRQYQNIVNGIMKEWFAKAWETGSVKIREDWQSVVPVSPAFTPVVLP